MDNLLDYIVYFENENNSFVEWKSNSKEEKYCFSYPVYDKKLLDFIKTIENSNLLCVDYLAKLNPYKNQNMIDYIRKADLETVKAIFTYYVRQERFGEGLWAKACSEGIFLNLLIRLRELREE